MHAVSQFMAAPCRKVLEAKLQTIKTIKPVAVDKKNQIGNKNSARLIGN